MQVPHYIYRDKVPFASCFVGSFGTSKETPERHKQA